MSRDASASAQARVLNQPASAVYAPQARAPMPIRQHAGQTRQQDYSIILPNDDRFSVADAMAAPWSGIAKVTAYHGEGRLSGSGTVIATRWLLTAAHVLDLDAGIPSVTVELAGSSIAADILPYLPSQAGHDVGDDVALLRLRSDPVGGLFQFVPYPADDDWLKTYQDAGYPLTVGGFPKSAQGAMEAASGPLVSWNAKVLQHDVDTTEGQSGSPLFYMAPAATYVLGVHVQGDKTDVAAPGVHNKAARITPTMGAWIQGAVAQG